MAEETTFFKDGSSLPWADPQSGLTARRVNAKNSENDLRFFKQLGSIQDPDQAAFLFDQAFFL
ncbi:MAG: hypothetical protein EBX52_13000 [Proteobacteria bacterium]|nr:hypothetical protein [Pseudomonadota bacterium]